MEWHFLVADHAGVRHFREDHELGLFTRDEYRLAFENSGLRFDIVGTVEDRERYVGRQSEPTQPDEEAAKP